MHLGPQGQDEGPRVPEVSQSGNKLLRGTRNSLNGILGKRTWRELGGILWNQSDPGAALAAWVCYPDGSSGGSAWEMTSAAKRSSCYKVAERVWELRDGLLAMVMRLMAKRDYLFIIWWWAFNFRQWQKCRTCNNCCVNH